MMKLSIRDSQSAICEYAGFMIQNKSVPKKIVKQHWTKIKLAFSYNEAETVDVFKEEIEKLSDQSKTLVVIKRLSHDYVRCFAITSLEDQKVPLNHKVYVIKEDKCYFMTLAQAERDYIDPDYRSLLRTLMLHQSKHPLYRNKKDLADRIVAERLNKDGCFSFDAFCEVCKAIGCGPEIMLAQIFISPYFGCNLSQASPAASGVFNF